MSAQRDARRQETNPALNVTVGVEPPPMDPCATGLRVAWVAEIPVPYRLGLYRRLREEAGIDLRLLFCAADQPDRDWELSLAGLPHVILPGRTLGANPREQFFLRANPRIWRELTSFRPDVVVVGGYAHLTMQWAMLWCRWTGTPYVINSESHHRRARSGLLRALKRLPVRLFVRNAAAALPAGTLAREYLVSYGGPRERMFLFPNTCDVARLARASERARGQRAALRQSLHLHSGPLLLYVGRLVPAKGLDTLLRAFHRIRQQHSSHEQQIRSPSEDAEGTSSLDPSARPVPQLLLVGDGEQRCELGALAAQLGISDHIRFAGSRPWDELPAFYAAADLLVLPSRFEPWGAVVNEAIACGLPVIVSDQVGCAPDLVNPAENGWIVPANNVESLASALAEALGDPARLAAMGAASSRLAPTWSEDTCLNAFVAAVTAVTDNRRQRTLRRTRRAA
jgi:glycosyltransferase involved in cell wall biosynthesis